MKKALTVAIVGLLLSSCSSSIEGEGAATQQKSFTVDQISDLDIACNCNVTLIPGNENGVKVESHQNIIDNLVVEGNKGNVVIKENKAVGNYSAYDVFVYVTRDLKDVEISKQTMLKVSGTLNVDDIKIELSDQSRMDNSYLITNNFKLNVDDQAIVDLKGTSISLIYKGSNQSQADLLAFETNDAQVSTSENAILNINTRKTLSGSAKGNSVINYLGEPTKNTKIADNAQVVKKE